MSGIYKVFNIDGRKYLHFAYIKLNLPNEFNKKSNNMKSLHLYLFLGLALLASGCSKKEPAAQGDEQTTQEDTFMKHIYDVPSAKFYMAGDDKSWYRFTKDENTTQVNNFIDMKSGGKADVTYKRVDEKSTNGTAQFQTNKHVVDWYSKGSPIGLIYSDIGFVTFTNKETKKEDKFVYAGGRPADIVNGDTEWDTKFVGTAYGYVDLRQNNKVIEQLFVSTDPATATIFIDKATQTETIVMPFKNWYRVTVVKTKDNKVTTKLDNEANKNIESKWIPVHYDWVENYQRGEFVQSNGLKVLKSTRVDSDDGDVSTVFSSMYFGPGIKTEAVVVGGRADMLNENIVRLNYVMGAVKADQ